ncbi:MULTISPECIES: hypothetical protein [Ruminococcus]|uniref:Uncharacterized protein n=1 Tax=Ruminococcus flavefaciens TaxID=1265 RepID=A0A1M7GF51_RUMFL|nr:MULTISPECIES: hypothetical protein [Ruminococcus]MCR4795649.1 hypothetical protein [Ruminococcus sp.]SHM14499.1 hypothetical protein SAMN04487860_101244 [Ruminococcus flavefaciens]
MKKFSLLPRAEKITVAELYSHKIKSKSSKDRLVTGWEIFAVITIVTALFLQSAILIAMGISAIVLSMQKGDGKLEHNGKVIKHNLWTALPFFLSGLALIFVGIIGLLMEIGISDKLSGKLFKMAAIIFLALIVLAFIIRLLHILAATVALKIRKKKCTVPVMAEFIGYAANSYDISMNREAPPGIDPLYKYYFEGVNYRFAVSENSPMLSEIGSNFEIMIDSEKPDVYYIEEMSHDNYEILCDYCILLVKVILIPAIIILGIIAFNNFTSHF